MRCPRGDGELIVRSAVGSGSIALTYNICLGCLGHWIEPFDANYLPLSALPNDTIKPEERASFHCPECNEPLERAHTDAMAPDVLAWYCPSGHGYFFPRGNLRRFRMAQEARVTYHKLWQIPMPPLRTVLLASIFFVAVLASTVTFIQIQQSQQAQTQARSIIVYHSAIVTEESVTIIARTAIPIELIVTSASLGIDASMDSTDGRTHTISLGAIPPGTYEYVFSFEVNGTNVTSETYTFEVP